MAFPNDDGELILDTNALAGTIGVVLAQIQIGVERVSQTLAKSEWNYCATDRELLTVKYFVEYYKHYLLG